MASDTERVRSSTLECWPSHKSYKNDKLKHRIFRSKGPRPGFVLYHLGEFPGVRFVLCNFGQHTAAVLYFNTFQAPGWPSLCKVLKYKTPGRILEKCESTRSRPALASTCHRDAQLRRRCDDTKTTSIAGTPPGTHSQTRRAHRRTHMCRPLRAHRRYTAGQARKPAGNAECFHKGFEHLPKTLPQCAWHEAKTFGGDG